MSSPVDFAKRFEEKVTTAGRELNGVATEDERYKSAIAGRREKFFALATRLIEAVIQRRMERLACFFSNARLSRDESASWCSYWFGCYERFLASSLVGYGVENDVRLERVAVCFDASMMRFFIKKNEHCWQTKPVDSIKDEVVDRSFEDRRCEFPGAYFRRYRGSDEFGEDVATDPICGMRIRRSSAAARESHCGHPYFFCSRECQELFARNPTDYVEVKTM